MRSHHRDALLDKAYPGSVAVVGPVSDEELRRGDAGAVVEHVLQQRLCRLRMPNLSQNMTLKDRGACPTLLGTGARCVD